MESLLPRSLIVLLTAALVLLPAASHIGGSGDLVVGRYLAELDFLRRALGLEVPTP